MLDLLSLIRCVSVCLSMFISGCFHHAAVRVSLHLCVSGCVCLCARCDELWPILSPHHHKDTYWAHFSQDTYLPNILTWKLHFSDTNQEKTNFVQDLSLSQQHVLMKFGNRCSSTKSRATFKLDNTQQHVYLIKSSGSLNALLCDASIVIIHWIHCAHAFLIWQVLYAGRSCLGNTSNTATKQEKTHRRALGCTPCQVCSFWKKWQNSAHHVET